MLSSQLRPAHWARRGTSRLPAVLAAITAGLLPLSEVPAQSLNLRVIAGNESNNRLLEVDFVSETTAVLNTDAETRAGISGLDFRIDLGTSGDPALNLLVTDPPRGQILIYRDLGPTGEIVYESSAEPGPRKPHAPSQDFAGNLYVVESSPGTSLDSRVWVFPRADGDYGAPVLLDDDFGGRSVRVLADTRVSPGAFGEPTRPDHLGIDAGPEQRKVANVSMHRATSFAASRLRLGEHVRHLV